MTPISRSAPRHGWMVEIAQRFASLTPQQMKTLRLICKGRANKEISYELDIPEATVKTHITAIMGKIGARRRGRKLFVGQVRLSFLMKSG